MLLVVLICWGLAPLALLLARRWPAATGWLLALGPAAGAVYLATLLPRAAAGAALSERWAWAPQLGLNLTLRADGWGLLFALLIAGAGALVLIYAGGYLKGHRDLGRFYFWLLIFMGAMLGVALADNLLLLFVFWELTSFSSFALIGFEHEREAARGAAQQALLVTGGGGLAMLAGFVLLGQAAGTLDLSALAGQAAVVQASPLYLPALGLILLGAFTKSAQFPFHFWLPNAMQAPTPVSAYLHSATMVKAGVYLLARMSLVLGGTAAWQWTVGGVGAATLVVATVLALTPTDLKRLLAYATVSALGLLVLLLGLGGAHAAEAAVVFLLAHALYKGALFLVAGIVDHETGTREVTQLGGLFRAMPITGAAAAVGALSLAGAPPLFGFIAKELAYESALDAGPWIIGVVVAAGIAYVFVAGQVGLTPFWGASRHTPKHPHEAPVSMWLGPVVLAGLSLLLGLIPGLANWLSIPASAVVGESVTFKLALWHGFNLTLLLSLATLAAGGLLYAVRRPLQAGLARLAWPYGPAWGYERLWQAVTNGAARTTRFFQSGYLRYYLLILTLTTSGLAVLTLIWMGGVPVPTWVVEAQFYEIALAALILFGAAIAVTARSRLSAVAAMGATGYGVALIFLVFGAPDLAMTQFLIESLTVILFVLVFYRLPRFTQLSSPRTRLRDAVVALLAGGVMTTLVLLAAGINWYPSIENFFMENSYALAHGRNVVNVILVDFRGFDTLGEITVLGIAGIGVYALLKLRPGSKP